MHAYYFINFAASALVHGRNSLKMKCTPEPQYYPSTLFAGYKNLRIQPKTCAVFQIIAQHLIYL